MKVFVINGPNLNLLGEREVEVYGSVKLDDINESMRVRGESLDFDLEFYQANHEGEIVDIVHRARSEARGIIINPAGYSHTSVAILDALLACELPIIEVHISNVHRRDEFRQTLLTAKASSGVIAGFGPHGYLLALEALHEILSKN